MIIECSVVPVLPRGPNFHMLVSVVVEPLKYMVKKFHEFCLFWSCEININMWR